ncbi:MAG TPA: ABC transporter ATP-binding protein [Trebonia sp.]|jgi:branched-chain amino acid transport system ATP-binding protein
MNDELVVTGISKQFSGVKAVSDVSFTVKPGEVHGLVGPNGAGKSTALGILSGFIPPDAGSITYRDRELVGAVPDNLVRAGIARTFQEPSPVAGLTVLENVLTGLHIQGRAGTLRAAVRSPLLRKEERLLKKEALDLLASVGLADRASADAGDLSFGELRYLEVIRCLGTGATMLLLDEPAAGMGKTETQRLTALIDEVRSQGRGVLLVDHDMGFIFSLCDAITVMNAGRVIADGTPHEIENSKTVREAYLGGSAEKPGPGGLSTGGLNSGGLSTSGLSTGRPEGA